jgi:predicted RNA binding protein YcfA (HicA-like mRNA interferase family)
MGRGLHLLSQDRQVKTAAKRSVKLLVTLVVVPLKVREVIRQLEKAGWLHVRTKGDDRVYRYLDGRITVISGKLGDDVRPGTYKAIL